tara:strand:+ start:171 stop:347 length:177 start_codon:yes stop_codon:yes gene_type:complete
MFIGTDITFGMIGHLIIHFNGVGVGIDGDIGIVGIDGTDLSIIGIVGIMVLGTIHHTM